MGAFLVPVKEQTSVVDDLIFKLVLKESQSARQWVDTPKDGEDRFLVSCQILGHNPATSANPRVEIACQVVWRELPKRLRAAVA
jgi:hypothetical protein